MEIEKFTNFLNDIDNLALNYLCDNSNLFLKKFMSKEEILLSKKFKGCLDKSSNSINLLIVVDNIFFKNVTQCFLFNITILNRYFIYILS